MSGNTFEFKDLPALKCIFVKDVLETRRKRDGELETICAVSPEAAVTRLRLEAEWIAKLLSLFAQAEDILRGLAWEVDASGHIAAQAEYESNIHGWAEERKAALDTLRRLAARGNDPLSREAEEKRDAALERLVPTMPANGRRDTPGVQRQPIDEGIDLHF